MSPFRLNILLFWWFSSFAFHYIVFCIQWCWCIVWMPIVSSAMAKFMKCLTKSVSIIWISNWQLDFHVTGWIFELMYNQLNKRVPFYCIDISFRRIISFFFAFIEIWKVNNSQLKSTVHWLKIQEITGECSLCQNNNNKKQCAVVHGIYSILLVLNEFLEICWKSHFAS